MWEWLINNHPVNTTISSLLQLMGKKRLGWLYPLNETAGLSMNWHVVSSSLAYTQVPPLYSWINLSKSILFFSRNPPSNCSKKWDASSFPMMALWPGVPLSWRNSSTSVNSSINKGISSFASTCNLTGWTLLKGRWLSYPRIMHMDHKQLYAFCPNSAANFSCWLTYQTNRKPFTYLCWADVLRRNAKLLSSLANWSSLIFRSGAFCSWCKSWSHFWNRNQMTMIDCSPSIIPKI